jgi:hypothetical protein
MQRQSLYPSSALILVLILISCDPCRYLDCVVDDHFGKFKIVSKIDGKDLVFGPNAIYDKTKIKFYSLNGIDTNFFQYTPTRISSSGYDSILYVRFLP